MENLGTLYTISAPSGGGKTSLVNALLERVFLLKVSVSHTTRPKRPQENLGENYFFIDTNEFNHLIKKDYFLEYAKVFEFYYGTSKYWVQEQLVQGIDVILEIDWQGGRQIRTLFPDSVSIFILPPSKPILQQRLHARGQDDEAVIKKRMDEASTEISHYHEYQYIIVNDDFEMALLDLQSIILGERLKSQRQMNKYVDLIENLLKRK